MSDASSEKKEEEKVENETKEVHDKEDEEKEENEVAEDKPDVPSESAEPKAEEEESAKDTEVPIFFVPSSFYWWASFLRSSDDNFYFNSFPGGCSNRCHVSCKSVTGSFRSLYLRTGKAHSCHYRVHTVSQRLNTVCQQLGDFIKLKRRVENPDLANLLSLLTGIESIVENKPEAMSEPEPEGIFYASNAAPKIDFSLDDNNVEFTMALKDDAGTKVDASFNKLAIKAIHMKSIKTLLEPSADVAPRKMHMVSLVSRDPIDSLSIRSQRRKMARLLCCTYV
ncbi:unnamed protein product, partial [Nesidiocoris tenuis]